MNSSIKARYSQKLAASLLGLGLSAIPILLLPRSLSPADLGNMDLITSVGLSLFAYLSLGIPVGFTNWNARHGINGAKIGVKFVVGFISVLGIVLFLLVCAANHFDILTRFLPDVGKKLFVLGIIFAWLSYAFQTCGQVFDSLALTKQSEILRVLHSILRASMCAGLFLLSALTPWTWLLLQSLGLVMAIAVYFVLWSPQRGNTPAPNNPKDAEAFFRFIRAFIRSFSLYSVLGLLFEVGDRLILQVFGGSTQQGYFAYAQRLAGVFTVFTAAFVPILQREFASEAEKDNVGRLAFLLEKNKLFVSIVSMVSIFFAIFSHYVVSALGGLSFSGSIPIFAVMALSPIHQTMGQLTNFLLVSIGKQQTYTRIGNLFLCTSLVASYFVLAPQSSTIPGAGLGALGLASKLFIFQLVFNNIYLYFLCRAIGSSFRSWISFQIFGPLFFGAFSFLAKWLVEFQMAGASALTILIFGFLAYGLGVAIVILRMPFLVGLTKRDIENLVARLSRLMGWT